jgi:hypothetical protein
MGMYVITVDCYSDERVVGVCSNAEQAVKLAKAAGATQGGTFQDWTVYGPFEDGTVLERDRTVVHDTGSSED